ncbi:MAG: hypothetical protein ACOCXJ_03515, partial [Planctomycetota bacterium]
MVMPSPFQRMLQQTGELANKQPDAAWERFDELSGKVSSPTELMHLAGFIANLGAAVLKRDAPTVERLEGLLTHPHVDPTTRRSVLRAMAVVLYCAGEEERASRCREEGVTNATEQCRLAIMTAQTLVARQQTHAAVPHLKRCAALVQELAADDDIVVQVANIGANVLRLAERQAVRARELLLAASGAVQESMGRHPDWRQQHMGLFQRAKAQLHAGNPTQALNGVQAMMRLENEHDADAFFRFQSAALACRGQLLRGQV